MGKNQKKKFEHDFIEEKKLVLKKSAEKNFSASSKKIPTLQKGKKKILHKINCPTSSPLPKNLMVHSFSSP